MSAVEPGPKRTNAGIRSNGPLDEDLFHSLVLINLFEIKALFLQKLLAPMLYAYSDGSRSKALRVMESITADEIRHIRYTGALINDGCPEISPLQMLEMIADFQRMLNLTTLRELEEIAETPDSDPGCTLFPEIRSSKELNS